MGYDQAPLFRAVVFVEDAQNTSKKIEKVLRRKLRVKSGHETDLTKADFAYFLPQIRPIWDDAWQVERQTDVMYFNLYSPDCFDRVYNYCRAFEYDTPSLSLSFPGALTRLRSRFFPSDRKTVYIDVHNEIESVEPVAIVQSRFFIQEVAKALQIEDRMEETDSGFVFEKKECDNRKVISFESNRSRINPQSLALQISETSFNIIESLFNDTVACLKQQFGELESIRLQRQVLHNEAAETAMEVAKIDDRWDMEFFSEYRKGFDPFTRPAEVEFERMYPVVRHISEPTENDFFLDLQVTVYHGLEESYLLLHTQRDQSFLQEIADEAGVKISEFGIKGYHGLEDLKI